MLLICLFFQFYKKVNNDKAKVSARELSEIEDRIESK